LVVRAEGLPLRLVLWFVDGMSIGQHALMQDARNQNTPTLPPIEQDVPAMLMAAQARANLIAESAQRGIAGKRLATSLKLADVTDGLGSAPFAEGVIGDAQQVSLSAPRKSKLAHG
jgi:hypothetical protein